ncbi:MAG: histidine phosphatase family protein [Myxococcales bacterium]|nr:histidine phosphatase family protein [Myxococcales bacterium]
MERRLILMRHAKSAWDAGAAQDHERPLNDRGRRDAPRVGARLCELGWVPDVVLSSDSLRTRQTWDGLASAFERALPGRRFTVCFLPELYLAGLTELGHALAAHAGDAATVLVLGHNPGWEEAGSFLAGLAVEMATADALLLCRRGGWAEATGKRGAWRLVEHLRPKAL